MTDKELMALIYSAGLTSNDIEKLFKYLLLLQTKEGGIKNIRKVMYDS